MSDLKRCPICGGEAQAWTREARDSDDWPVTCKNNDCPLTRRGIERKAWNALPRRDESVAEVVREMRENAQEWKSVAAEMAAEGDRNSWGLANAAAIEFKRYADRLEATAEPEQPVCEWCQQRTDCNICMDCFEGERRRLARAEPNDAAVKLAEVVREMRTDAAWLSLGANDLFYFRRHLDDWIRRLEVTAGPVRARAEVWVDAAAHVGPGDVIIFTSNKEALEAKKCSRGFLAPVLGAPPDPDCQDAGADMTLKEADDREKESVWKAISKLEGWKDWADNQLQEIHHDLHVHDHDEPQACFVCDSEEGCDCVASDPDCQECEETPEADEVGRLLRKAQDNLKRNMPPRAIGNLIGAVEALAERVGRHQDGDTPE